MSHQYICFGFYGAGFFFSSFSSELFLPCFILRVFYFYFFYSRYYIEIEHVDSTMHLHMIYVYFVYIKRKNVCVNIIFFSLSRLRVRCTNNWSNIFINSKQGSIISNEYIYLCIKIKKSYRSQYALF